MEFYDKKVVLSCKTTAAKFEEFRRNLKFCDVTLQSGQVFVKAHRVVLVAASPYFEAIINEGLQENKELVNCSDIPSDVLLSLVDFLYTDVYRNDVAWEQCDLKEDVMTRIEKRTLKGQRFEIIYVRCSPNPKVDIAVPQPRGDNIFLVEVESLSYKVGGHVAIESSTAQKLMAAAHMTCLDGLVIGCARYLKTQLNTSNALSMLSFAENLGCSKLSECALDYIGEHWTIIAKSKELLELSVIAFIRILSSDRFAPNNEHEVVLAVVRWLEHEPAARAPHCSELVCHLHLGRVPADVLDEMWRNVEDTRVAEGLHLSKKNTAATFGSSINHTASYSSVTVFIFLQAAITNASARSRGAFYVVRNHRISKYDTQKKVWEDLVPMIACRHNLGLAALGDRLYFVGGQSKEEHLRSGEAYDRNTNTWSPIASLNEGRSHFALAALKGKLYAFGGYGDNGELSSVEVYDPRTDVWLRAGDLPQAMADLRAVTYNGAIYVMDRQLLLRYQPSAEPHDEWHTCTEINAERTFCPAVLGDHLYVMGGNGWTDFLDTVLRYSFATDQWETTTPISTGLENYVAGAAGDVLFVLGDGRFEMYDAYVKRWTLDIEAPDTRDITDCIWVQW
ncbi:Kelch-like protein 17 [Eumeta japonica]|uniref:Kelch-like protein diablo n=1 Tax=Eumeta variegata TaxID=151549 RepID=A0A4C1WLF5_EUMVA|nr:Kelch-like protein 17 [Eumeta japonica]